MISRTDSVLPLLKPAAWDQRAQMVCRPLFAGAAMPFVAYGWDRPNTFEILGRGAAGDATPESLEPKALANLRTRNGSWETLDIKVGWFKKVRLLVCGNDFLAAERILDAEFMKAGQSKLGAKLLAVGIPRRGMLMACDGARSPEDLARFSAAVAGQFHRGEAPPITPTVFAVLDGEIIGHLDSGDIVDEVKAAVEGEPGDDIYVQSMTFEADGRRRAVICAGGDSLDQLAARIRRELAQLVGKYGEELHAEVAIIPDLTPRTAALDAWLPTLAAGLTGLARELQVPHDVRVTYGQPPR